MDQTRQTVAFGRLRAVSEQERKSYQTRKILGRFWSKDVSLWPADPSQQRVIRNNLSWVDLPELLEPLLPEFSELSDACIKEGLAELIFIALGSSGLAARALIPLLKAPLPNGFSVMDSCHPSAIRRLASKIDLLRTVFILANKAGDRLEDLSLFLYFQQLLTSADVPNVNRHFISLTEENSFLAGISHGYTFRASFLDPPHILSSYSSTLHFGALLTGLSVIEHQASMRSIRTMRELCTGPSTANPALELAIFLSTVSVACCRYLIFLTSPTLAAYSDRLGHLIGGSLAAGDTGLIPVSGGTSRNTAGVQEHAAFVVLTRKDEADGELTAKLDDLRASGAPCVQIQIACAADLLPETFKWEIAVALACASIGQNPFEWPNIRQPRKIAMDILESLASDEHALDRSPRLQESELQLFADGRTRSEISSLSFQESMRSFFRLSSPEGFIVLFAFLERTPEVEKGLWELRELLTAKLSVPVLLQFGPRCADLYPFLYRSGLPRALYIILCGDYPDDMPVPGARYTFSQLHRALILGEFESLAQTEQAVIRLKLGGEPEVSLSRLKHLLLQVFPRT